MNTLAQRQQTAAKALDDYTSASGRYAFRTYDAQPANNSGRLRPEDILAANLLSLRLSGSDVIPLFAEGAGAPQELLAAMNEALNGFRDVQPYETFASTGELDQALSALKRANKAAGRVAGWTSVTVSKVLHRHAPRVVPIIDSRVRSFYGVDKKHDGMLYHRIWDDVVKNKDWLAGLGQEYRTSDGRELSVLRVADILIWMPSNDVNAPTVDDLTPDTWDREGMEARGWEGFIPLSTLDSSGVPDSPGVYAVLRDGDATPGFLTERPHATARQANSYTVSDLHSRWVSGVQVLNIGRAGTSLRRRLCQYRQFGGGVGLNHKGGRSIWQLSEADRLTVAWRTFPVTYDGLSTRGAESGLITKFQEAHGGAKPFANRVR